MATTHLPFDPSPSTAPMNTDPSESSASDQVTSSRSRAAKKTRHAVDREKDKFSLIVGLPRDKEELHDSYQSIFGTVAIVAALFLSTLVSREGYDVTVHHNSVWGDESAAETGVQLYELAIGASSASCIVTILLCIGLSVQLSHVPRKHTRQLLEEFGLFYTQAPGSLFLCIAISYIITLALQFSLVFEPWVAWVSIALLVLTCIAFGKIGMVLIEKKMRVLQRIKAGEYGEQEIEIDHI